MTDSTSRSRVEVPTRNAGGWYDLLHTRESSPMNDWFMRVMSDPLGAFGSFGNFESPPEGVPLRLLGLSEKPSTRADVTSAYRRQLLRVHPDIGMYSVPEMSEAVRAVAANKPEVQELIWARDVLLRMIHEPSQSNGGGNGATRTGAGVGVTTGSVTDANESARGQDMTRNGTYNAAARIEAEHRERRIRQGDTKWSKVPRTEIEWARSIRQAIVRRSRQSAELCYRCGRDLEPTDPVVRGTWAEGVECMDCVGQSPFHREVRLRDCENCGRPAGSWRAWGWRTFCCGRCSSAYYARQRRAWNAEVRKAERGPWLCVGCDEVIDGLRADARYCSSACRQRAYRQRRAAP